MTFLLASDIKTACEEYLSNLYPDNTNIKMHILNNAVEFAKKVGDTGKLFGSVTSQDIADSVAKKGFEIDKRKLQIKESIKSLGDFKVPYKIHPEVTAEIKVKVIKEEVKGKDSEKIEEKPAENKE